MRSAVLHWTILGLTALALQACGEQQPAEPARRTKKTTQSSSSDQTAGSTQVPSGNIPTTGNNNIPTPPGGTPTAETDTGAGTGTIPSTTPSPQTPSSDTENGRVLNMGTVFNQGSTQWCWAYSTYHALRTFYENSTATDSETTTWRNSLSQLNTASAFSSFMQKKYNSQRTGYPSEFLNLMQSTYNLPSVTDRWTEYYPKGYSDVKFGFVGDVDYGPVATNRNSTDAQVLTKVQDQIRLGMPAVYCDSGHCMSIYGFTKNGTSISYNVADSMGGRKYTETESKVKQRLFMMMTHSP